MVTVSAIGGGSVPAPNGRVISSGIWRVAITLTDVGVTVEIRDIWLNRLLRPRGPLAPKPERLPVRWFAEWTKLSQVDTARRSLLFYVDQQPRCRFLPITHRQVTAIVQELIRHEVPVRRVRTTIKFLVSHRWG
jgi:hypothetical protein